jgi:hypothetical protein
VGDGGGLTEEVAGVDITAGYQPGAAQRAAGVSLRRLISRFSPPTKDENFCPFQFHYFRCSTSLFPLLNCNSRKNEEAALIAVQLS